MLVTLLHDSSTEILFTRGDGIVRTLDRCMIILKKSDYTYFVQMQNMSLYLGKLRLKIVILLILPKLRTTIIFSLW